jgi:hypothetical protein
MLNVIAMDTNLVCRTNDVTSLDQTNPILVDNTSYKVRELTHDTVGITTIGIIKE